MRLDPRNSPGLVGWWDAGYGVSLVGATSDVFQWLDRSGAGNTLTQATGANQPAYSVVSNKPRLTMGAAKYMGSPAAATPFSLGASRTIYVAGGGATAGGSVLHFGGGTPNYHMYLSQTYIAAGFLITDGVANNSKITGPAYTTQFVFALTSVVGEFPAVRLNAVAKEVTAQAGTGFVVAENAQGQFYVGYSSGSFDGYLNEILVFSGVHSGAEIINVEAYLAAKWGGI